MFFHIFNEVSGLISTRLKKISISACLLLYKVFLDSNSYQSWVGKFFLDDDNVFQELSIGSYLKVFTDFPAFEIILYGCGS